MSKQDIVDYVMETPHNTNKAVLEGLVDTAIEESQVQADWSQNDETAKDYIKNRPGGYYAEKEAAKISSKEILKAKQTSGSIRLSTSDGIDVLDSSTEEIKNNIHLYYMNQRFRLKYKGDSQRGSTWEPITTSNYL